jgi:hypothetical protein
VELIAASAAFAEPGIAVAPYALDPENARRLWELSLAAVS